ncbi:MAG: hypothetical protein ACYCQI_05580 [Gammaproteobacteria bacterium]
MMMKKILMAVLVGLVSTGALAKSDNVKMVQASHDEPSSWSIDGPDFWSFGLIVDVPKKPKTVIFYVNSYRTSNPSLASDPVLIDCNGVPTMLNPGSSAVCQINQQGYNTITWEIDARYRHNGSDGYTISL